MIGDDIEVIVIRVERDKVRLGIGAPSDVPVFRNEIHTEIQPERKATEASGPT
jgi:carbon storage regulator